MYYLGGTMKLLRGSSIIQTCKEASDDKVLLVLNAIDDDALAKQRILEENSIPKTIRDIHRITRLKENSKNMTRHTAGQAM
jgi:hypothetical protein